MTRREWKFVNDGRGLEKFGCKGGEKEALLNGANSGTYAVNLLHLDVSADCADFTDFQQAI